MAKSRMFMFSEQMNLLKHLKVELSPSITVSMTQKINGLYHLAAPTILMKKYFRQFIFKSNILKGN